MAKHAHTTDRRTTICAVDRRSLASGLFAIVAGTGITAGAAASVADFAIPLAPPPDAELLALADRLEIARIQIGAINVGVPEPTDAEIDAAVDAMSDVCDAIIDAPRASTLAGRALKAAAAMHQLGSVFNYGQWPGRAQESAWNVLSEIAGPAYVETDVPAEKRDSWRPKRKAC